MKVGSESHKATSHRTTRQKNCFYRLIIACKQPNIFLFTREKEASNQTPLNKLKETDLVSCSH
jgi:hypothetical protein